MLGSNSNFEGCTSSGHIKAQCHILLLHKLHSLSMTCSSYHKINCFNFNISQGFISKSPFNLVGSKVKYFKVTVSFYCSLYAKLLVCILKFRQLYFGLNIWRCLYLLFMIDLFASKETLKEIYVSAPVILSARYLATYCVQYIARYPTRCNVAQ